MANRVQHLRHTSTALANFTGLEAEITVNLANNTVVVHDGITPGGHEQALADLSNVNAATVAVPGKMTDQHVRDIAQTLADTVLNASNVSLNTVDIGNNLIAINNNAAAIAQNSQDISNLTGGQGAYLLLAGGTMTGVLVLAADPVGNLEPATKQYTDAEDAATELSAFMYTDGFIAALQASKADKAGDTFTGPVILNADPTAALGAATKQFVEAEVLNTLEAARTPGDITCVTSGGQILAVNSVVEQLFKARFSRPGKYRIRLFIRALKVNNVATTITLKLYFNGVLQGSPFVYNVPFPRSIGNTDTIVYDMPTDVTTTDVVHLTHEYNQVNGADFIEVDLISISSAEAASHIVYLKGADIAGVVF